MTSLARSTRAKFLAALFCGATLSAFATTRTVTSLADSGPGSLRATIAASADGDTITFANGVTGTITLTSGEMVIGHSVTMTGPGAALLTLSGNASSRVFNILSGTVVSMSGVSVANGRTTGADATTISAAGDAEGGGILNNGHLTLSHCVLSGNQ